MHTFMIPLLAMTLNAQATYDWPLRIPFQVINTVATLQFYGPTPGFHHGLDLHAQAGTSVYAPVSGTFSMGYYYPPQQNAYTYGVFIDGEDGYRWEFHHIDQTTITQAKGHISAGSFMAKIYDAPQFDARILPHVHIDVIDKNGVHHNPLKFFPRLEDTAPPEIRGIYVVDKKGQVLSQSHAGDFELVIDVIDLIPPATHGDAIHTLTATYGGQPLGRIDFDRLPNKSYLKGVDAIYRLEPITLSDGTQLENQVDSNSPRRFLYHFPIRLKSAPDTIEIEATDFAGNTTKKTAIY